MEIPEPIKLRDVIDYDFMFISGAKLVVTVDAKAGDQFEERGDRYWIKLVSKPVVGDPAEVTDTEEMEVFKTSLAAINRCERKQRMPTEEELFDMQRTLHALAKSVQ